MAGFFAGVIAGVALVGLILIVLTPSRRLRSEARLDREIETRLLLGVDPEATDQVPVVDAAALQRASAESHRPDFGAAELQALRQIGVERSSGKRGSSRRRSG